MADQVRSFVNLFLTVSVAPPPSTAPPGKVLVVFGNPDPEHSFSAEIRRRTLQGLLKRGHEVKVVNVSDGSFDPILRGPEFKQRYTHPIQSEELKSHADLLTWCDQIVWIYPTWWSSVPAGLKGWIDRVFVAGVAYQPPSQANSAITPLLNIKKSAVITTWGGSRAIPWYTGDLGSRMLCRSLPMACYRASFPETLFLKLHNVYESPDRRERFLASVEEQMSLF